MASGWNTIGTSVTRGPLRASGLVEQGAKRNDSFTSSETGPVGPLAGFGQAQEGEGDDGVVTNQVDLTKDAAGARAAGTRTHSLRPEGS